MALYVRARAAASTRWRARSSRAARHGRAFDVRTSLRDVPRLHRDHAGDHVLGRRAAARLERRLLQRRAADHRLAERHGGRGRLHERRVVPRHRRASSPSTATTASCTPSAGWSPTSPCCCSSPSRCATPANTRWPTCWRYRLRRARCAAMARAVDADRQPVLHDRADGRRRLAGQPAARPGISFNTAIIGVGVLMLVYVDLRRHAGDDLGADRQGGAADGAARSCSASWCWRTSISSFGEFFDAIAHVTAVLRDGRRGDEDFLRRRGLRTSRSRPATGALDPDLARHRADLRDGGAAAHPGPLLHRARRRRRRAPRWSGR